jgi:hypothetical protein
MKFIWKDLDLGRGKYLFLNVIFTTENSNKFQKILEGKIS